GDAVPIGEIALMSSAHGASSAHARPEASLVRPHPADPPRIEDRASKSPEPDIDLTEEIWSEANNRRWVGRVTGLAVIVLVAAIIVYALWSLDRLLPAILARESDRLIVIVALVAHAIVSVAAVYFGYSMLRIAERMFLPRRLFLHTKDVE